MTPPVELTGASAVLDGAEDIVVLGRCTSGDEVVGMAARLRPDVMVMGVAMPGPSASEALGGINAGPLGLSRYADPSAHSHKARRCLRSLVGVLDGAVMCGSERNGRSAVGMLVG